MKPAAIDFTVKDLDEAKNFFEQVFDWRFVKFPESYDYYVSRAGSKILPGVNVAIGAIADNPHAKGRPLTQVIVSVPSVDDCITKVEEAGGKVISPKGAIPGIGWFAGCAEPGGLLFGVLESDRKAK